MLLSKKNIMKLAKAAVFNGCDALFMGHSREGTNFCVIAGSDPLKTPEDSYLLVNRLLNALKNNLARENQLELEFSLSMINEGGKNDKTTPDHEARRSVRNRRKR